MFNPILFPIFGASQKSPAQKAEEARQKMADDFAKGLEEMTPEERQEFWNQHDKDTSSSNE
ncbi:MAG: hypothetical protein HN919_22080 [Verrucomicrobia bacterium]|jgi:hypothetical protein|nr:hypothetical protein [Verrucomicrobiota bacterium]